MAAIAVVFDGSGGDGGGSNGIFATAINADDGIVVTVSTTPAKVDDDNRHCCRYHWSKTPLLQMPLRHCPSIPLLPPLTMTAIDKDHHCHGCINHRFCQHDLHCCRQQQNMTTGFWRLSSLTVWQR
jgi:hypothetical protein